MKSCVNLGGTEALFIPANNFDKFPYAFTYGGYVADIDAPLEFDWEIAT